MMANKVGKLIDWFCGFSMLHFYIIRLGHCVHFLLVLQVLVLFPLIFFIKKNSY